MKTSAGEQEQTKQPIRGMAAVQEAVTFAAHLLAQLKRSSSLDEMDRRACAVAQEALEAAENILYGR